MLIIYIHELLWGNFDWNFDIFKSVHWSIQIQAFDADCNAYVFFILHTVDIVPNKFSDDATSDTRSKFVWVVN